MQELLSISAEIRPEDFFNRYIVTRTPIKFHNTIQETPWNINLWTNAYLKGKAGKTDVKVEYREDLQGKFGKGNEKTMKFEEFIDHLTSGDQRWYLTTQKLDYTPEGQPKIISPPITELLDDIPLRPKIMGNLIPQNVNIWMGSSDRPTTSGLHHDFHDNIYILLRGRKTIKLYPPSEYKNMYLVGNVSRLYPNGRFNYQGQPTLADGSSVGSVEALEASILLDNAVLKLENEDSDAEEEIDNALEALLDAQIAGFEDEDEDEDGEEDGEEEENGDDDYCDDEDPDEGELVSNENGNEEGGEEEEVEEEEGLNAAEANYLGLKRDRAHSLERSNSKKSKSNFSLTSNQNSSNQEKQKQEQRQEQGQGQENEEEEEESLSKKDPPSFSRVDTDAPRDVLERDFPLFLDAESRGFVVTLEAGEMLYIPAGWFHEVRSVGSAAEGGHMALNYWFHPPDGSTFDKPYQSKFWENDWKERKLD